jgi:hypothetical protein
MQALSWLVMSGAGPVLVDGIHPSPIAHTFDPITVALSFR